MINKVEVTLATIKEFGISKAITISFMARMHPTIPMSSRKLSSIIPYSKSSISTTISDLESKGHLTSCSQYYKFTDNFIDSHKELFNF